MTGIACVRASGLLAKRASGLTDAERLHLEEHLASCDRCGDDARDLSVLTRLALSDAMPALGDRARSRALSNALSQAMPAAIAPRRALGGWFPSVALAGTAAAIAFALFGTGDDVAPREPAVATATQPAPEAPPAMPADELVRVDAPQTMSAAHAVVRLEAGTAARWNPGTSTLRLRSGAIAAAVDPEKHEPFRVRTRRFTAEVTGTKLEVTPRSVRVTEGTVRIFAPSGDVYVDELVAGEEWRAPVVVKAPARPDTDDLLAKARSKLAAGNVEAARGEVRAALRTRPSRTDRAEAQTLLAECELVAGNDAKAARMYLRVANQYRDLRAGETALFAAARTRANAGQDDKARTLLERYLDRYPEGRFREEAKGRLQGLE